MIAPVYTDYKVRRQMNTVHTRRVDPALLASASLAARTILLPRAQHFNQIQPPAKLSRSEQFEEITNNTKNNKTLNIFLFFKSHNKLCDLIYNQLSETLLFFLTGHSA